MIEGQAKGRPSSGGVWPVTLACGCVVEQNEADGATGVYSRWWMSKLCLVAQELYEDTNQAGCDEMHFHLADVPYTMEAIGPRMFGPEDKAISKLIDSPGPVDFDSLVKAWKNAAFKYGQDIAKIIDQAAVDAILRN